MSNSFVVRFHTLTPDQKNWKGQVEHVQSGEKSVFNGGTELLRVFETLSQRAQETSKHSTLTKDS